MICVGCDVSKLGPGEIRVPFDNLIDQLISNGICVLEYSDTRMIVQTPHVYIQFVNNLDLLRGRKIDKVIDCNCRSIEHVFEYVSDTESKFERLKEEKYKREHDIRR